MKFIDDDDHFRKFTEKLAREIDKYPSVNEKALLEFQKEQVERLVELETEFRQHLVKTGDPYEVYPKFIHHICEVRRNILASRPYFRERQDVFTAHISDIFKRKDHEALKKYHFNFPFISLAIREFGCSEDKNLLRIYKEIKKLRIELVERNMPLAISRARIFWNKTPKSHLTYMDLIQIAAEGMLSAIDKYVLPFSSVFRSVAIGRMVGNFIENYSETTVHFFPVDKRKIYRANKVAHWYSTGNEVDYEEIAKRVNEGIDQKDHHTTASEIADLMQAASCVPSGAFAGVLEAREAAMDDEASDETSSGEAHDGLRPDLLTEQSDSYRVLANAIEQLSIFEQKILKLKGVQFYPTEVA